MLPSCITSTNINFLPTIHIPKYKFTSNQIRSLRIRKLAELEERTKNVEDRVVELGRGHVGRGEAEQRIWLLVRRVLKIAKALGGSGRR